MNPQSLSLRPGTDNRMIPDISIIVPVYNVEKYLDRCLASISNQSFSGSLEIIAVEDGSTDNSLNILKKYQTGESRLKIIEHGRNKSLAVARRTGMNASTGRYIMHVDSDDWLLPGCLEKIYSKCIETDADVIVFNYVRETINGKRINTAQIAKEICTSDKKIVQKHFYGACWNKIVKRKVTDDMIYGQTGINSEEDLLYSSELLLKAVKICLYPECCYSWFINSQSITNSLEPELFLKNQETVLKQLELLFRRYEIDKTLADNILNYFEKWIYLLLCRSYFLNDNKLKESQAHILELFQRSPIINDIRINRLMSSFSSRAVILKYVTKYFGLKMSLGIIARSIINN